MSDFAKTSQISHLVFKPYTLALNGIGQAVWFILLELLLQTFCKQTFAREKLVLKDGGTVALDWDKQMPDPKEKPDKPILLMIPGVAGDSENLYQTDLLRHIRHKFRVVIMVSRGSGGLPLTSARLNCINTWDDLKPVVKHLDEKYVGRDAKGHKRTRLYIYGASLGGS